MANKRGRAPTPVKTSHGRAIKRILDEQDLDITNAARVAGCSFQVVHNLLHRSVLPSMTSATIEKLHRRLKIPLDLLSPKATRAKAS